VNYRLARTLGNGVVADHARDLLNEVLFYRDVKAMRRRCHLPSRGRILHCHLQCAEHALHGFGRDGGAKEPSEARRAQADCGTLGLVQIRMDACDRPCPAACDLEQELARALHRTQLQSRIHAALVMLARIGLQAEAAGAALDGRRCEKRDFQENITGAGGDCGARAPHDAGKPHGSVAVGDDEHVRAEIHRACIEKLQTLCGARMPNADLAAERREIIGVHRLAELEQHVVRDIDDGADAAHVRAVQPRAQPRRCQRLIVDATDHPAAERRAVCRRVDLRGECIRERLGNGPAHRTHERLACQRRHLARDPQQRHHIATIGRDVELQNRIVGTCHQAFELKPRHRQARAKFARLPGHVDPLFEPAVGKLHDQKARNWRRKRRSLSKKSRRSFTP